MSKTATVKLTTRIDNNGQSISELTFREAEIGDLIAGSKYETELEQTIAVLASVSDTPLHVFKKIKASDLKLIMKQASALLGNEEPTPTGSE